jgi:hypothetical protein
MWLLQAGIIPEAGYMNKRGEPVRKDELGGELKFHYSREERLRKRHRPPYDRKSSLFFRRKGRSLIIIVVDIFLIAIVLFYLNKPANVLIQKEQRGLIYEFNVTGVRGKKILIGFTIRNEGEAEVTISPDPVTLRITDRSGDTQTFQKPMEHSTILQLGESSSTIFLLREEELPGSGLTELFYGTDTQALFSKNIRF